MPRTRGGRSTSYVRTPASAPTGLRTSFPATRPGLTEFVGMKYPMRHSAFVKVHDLPLRLRLCPRAGVGADCGPLA
jgi:hypothetical protein